MNTRPAERPSLGVVLAGGFAVAVVLAFVGAVAFGGRVRSSPGERVDVVKGRGPAGLEILAGRCAEQRVTGVVLRSADGTVLWQVASATWARSNGVTSWAATRPMAGTSCLKRAGRRWTRHRRPCLAISLAT